MSHDRGRRAGRRVVAGVGESAGKGGAVDARSGDLLWSVQTGSGIHSGPITCVVNGRQYVGVASGWGAWMKGFAPELCGETRGSALLAFELP